jgi:HSP20 family molecular chaperone IbpA
MSDCTVSNCQITAPQIAAPQNSAQESTHETDRFTTPPVDIFETAEGLTVVADLPGIAPQALNVSVEKDVLTIRATQSNSSSSARNYAYREFEPAGYFRQFRLGSKIEQTGIKADYQLGVLRLTLPFAAEAKPRVIDVKIA